MTTKQCGECTACCTSLKVASMDKGVNEPCRLVTEKGCAEYDERPDECRKFSCLWLRSGKFFVDDSMRPDRCGILVTAAPTPAGKGIHVYELEPHAAEREINQEILRFYNSLFPVVVVPTQGSTGQLYQIRRAG